MGDNRKHNNVEQVHKQEAGAISDVHEKLLHAASTKDVHQLPSSSTELTVSVTDWEKQFASLPQKDGKLDTARFSEKDWQQAHEMYTELNKPGGRIEQVASIAKQTAGALDTNMTMMHYA